MARRYTMDDVVEAVGEINPDRLLELADLLREKKPLSARLLQERLNNNDPAQHVEAGALQTKPAVAASCHVCLSPDVR